MSQHIINCNILSLSILLGTLLLAIGLFTAHSKTKIIAVLLLLLSSISTVVIFYLGKVNLDLGWQQLEASETLVHFHQKNIEFLLVTAVLLGIISSVNLILYFKKSKFIKVAYVATLLISLVVSVESYLVVKSGHEIMATDKSPSTQVIEID
ncbi:MAG: hypothetical protein WC967_01875 [Balneolaceae bacterium]